MAEQIIIDIDECIGCEACMETCPEVFGFDDDTEKAYVLSGADKDLECVDEAIASCPVECISRAEE